jgi:membrane associated rhomboid family serine protease
MLVFVLLLWILEVLDQVVFNGVLDFLGIIPRDVNRLWAVLIVPLLHAGYGHLAGNAILLVVFGTLTGLTSPRSYLAVSSALYLFSGMFIWLLAPGNRILIGASGLCYAYFGYILGRGFFGCSPFSLAISAFVATLFCPILVEGVFPNAYTVNVSWEGHLIGFLVGAGVAFFQGRRS